MTGLALRPLFATPDTMDERTAAEVMDQRSRSSIPWALAAALLFISTIAARWPGVVMYDSVGQFSQARDGAYGDWHPPIMARLWALLNHVHAGTEPFFLIQMLLWWGGLGLLAAALGRQARHGAAAFVLLIGASPLFLGWATVVLKDAQMACCLVAATGIAAHWLLAARTPPVWARAVILILIAYATLVRGNAAFATVPFALALFGWAGVARFSGRIGLLVILTATVLALSGPINHRILGAEPNHAERSLPLYDLAGIAHFAPLKTIPGLAPGQWAEAEKRGCYTPFFWNPYGEPAECGFIGDRMAFGDKASEGIMRVWIGAVVRHPIAFARHRIGHLNSNLRFWVGPGERDALPPLYSEPNTFGLGAPPTAAARELITGAGFMVASPLGWPTLWLAVALGLLWANARNAGNGQARLGRALALSAAVMSASFALVSIASDLRYHLWSMVAAALALVLLIDARALERRRSIVAGGAVLALMAVASLGHIGLARDVSQPQPVFIPLPGKKF
jgi:hypothetical protein